MSGCIIFDLDGTLIDSRKDLTTGVNLMRKHFNLEPLSLDTVTGYVGNGARKLVERALRNTGVDADEALPLMKQFYIENMCNETSLYPGVKKGLAELSGHGWKMAVITNKPQDPCEKILFHLGIKDHFNWTIGGSPKFPLKPDPAALLYVLSESSSNPAESWMVGDNYTDLESGRRAGMKCFFAEWGFGNPREESYDHSADSFPEFVEKLNT